MKKILILITVLSFVSLGELHANNDKTTGAKLDHGVLGVLLPGVPPIVVPTTTPKN